VKRPFPSIHAQSSVTLSLIVPSYNEERRLPTMLDATLEFLRKKKSMNKNFTFEIIIVDDGSKDKTSSVALSYVAKHGADTIRLLKLKTNRGKGGAVKMVR
jgi:dolichyl-phosphate beta-glucosyltransferase